MKKVELLCGRDLVVKSPLRPYHDRICEFLDAWSKELRRDAEAKKYADLQTFAFWIRKSNIQKKKKEYNIRNKGRTLLGKGLVFHIAPSNVPVNCFYSYVFGLLAGNSNIVRVPSKKFPQVECACRVLQDIFSLEGYEQIGARTLFVRYERDDEITAEYSAQCNSRVIWGGDQTIREVRKVILPPRSNEITFADRYSFGIVSLSVLQGMDTVSLNRLAMDFYNDTYLMDQNACSAPHIILWKREINMPDEIITKLQNRFWKAVADVAAKYNLEDMKVSEKYSLLCNSLIEFDCISDCQRFGNLLYVCTFDKLPQELTRYRGKYGLFYQTQVEDWSWLERMSDEKIQTCACFGVVQEEIQQQIVEKGITGIDRIVPFGKTLDIDVIWDGYDIIQQLSRVIASFDGGGLE